MLDRVLDALGTLRSPFAPYEADLHLRVGECLRAAGLPAVHEALLAPGCRIDYLVGGVGVEIKKGRPDPAALRRQLDAAGCPQRAELPFHKLLLNGTLPLTMGGGIGQSRLCMLLLGKAHIGEVQVSLWDAETKAVCERAGVQLL